MDGKLDDIKGLLLSRHDNGRVPILKIISTFQLETYTETIIAKMAQFLWFCFNFHRKTR